MNSRVPWGVKGVRPSVRETARAAARRSGVSVGEWLNSAILETAQDAGHHDTAVKPTPMSGLGEIHARLDRLSREIERLSKTSGQAQGGAKGEALLARHLNEAIERLDKQMGRIPGAGETHHASAAGENESQARRSAPPDTESEMARAVAELGARRNELDKLDRRLPVHPAPATAPSSPDFSGLQSQIRHITSQIETLRAPPGLEQATALFRKELGDIRQTILDAMPRRAIESLEGEVRALSQRIDAARDHNGDAAAIGGIEKTLREIREALHNLTPAEQLRGYDQAIRNLSDKLDVILRESPDHSAFHQLEAAIAALRAIVTNVASGDALARLSDDVRILSERVDRLAAREPNNSILEALEKRIGELTTTLETRERPSANSGMAEMEGAVRALSERIDRLGAMDGDSAAYSHLERRVGELIARVEAIGSTIGDFGKIERGLNEILTRIEHQRAALENFQPPETVDRALIEVIKRDLADIRLDQYQSEQRTQDSLETVHSTLDHVVGRIATIESDLRQRPAATSAASPSPTAEADPGLSAQTAPRKEPQAAPVHPNLPNPVPPSTGPDASSSSSEPASVETISPGTDDEAPTARSRPPIDPTLPPDYPLEPGLSRPGDHTQGQRSGETPSAATASGARIAGTGATTTIDSGSGSKSNFIAAARRAAQAAQAAAGKSEIKIERPKPNRASVSNFDGPSAEPETSTVSHKLRQMLVGASVVVIVLGTLRMAVTMFSGNEDPSAPAMTKSSALFAPGPGTAPETTASTSRSEPQSAASAAPVVSAPNTAVTAQVLAPTAPSFPTVPNSGVLGAAAVGPSAARPMAAPTPDAGPDVTSSIPEQEAPIPATIATTKVAAPPISAAAQAAQAQTLVAAAQAGDGAAAYELASRYSEGRGMAADPAEAFKWYERAAAKGIVPAMFRVGSMYEKGLGVKKDAGKAKASYIAAASHGNAKAMHNLAVLYADGGGKTPDYKAAATWFRKAADHGVADSQYNLGILYARGIGVEQNLSESYKWFALAAAQGDVEAGRKRADIAKRLDPGSLSVAQQAVAAFKAVPQPADATQVPPADLNKAAAGKLKSRPKSKAPART